MTSDSATPSTFAASAGPSSSGVPLAADAATALGVTLADVMSVLESGELKGKKIGTSWRISRAALNSYLAE